MGQVGQNFVEYGVHAARAALADAGIAWPDVDLVVGGETVRNGYAGYVAGATFAQALGWNGARVATSYAACATGAQALDTARARIMAGLSEVALVVGADTTPKGFLAPNAGERWDDPDWLRFRLLGMTNPAYFALYARRRMDLYGATPEDFAPVKVKNARHGLANPHARYRKEVSVDDVMASAVVSDPLHLLDICATCDGGGRGRARAATTTPRQLGADATRSRIRRDLDGHPDVPEHRDRHAVAVDRLDVGGAGQPDRTFKESIGHAAYEEAGIGPDDVDVAEVYDLSTALELDWMEDLALCRRGEAEQLLRAGETTIGGRIPVNPSRRAGLLRRGRAGAGAGPGLRAHLAAPRPGRGTAGRGCPRRASPPTRDSSVTARRCCCPGDVLPWRVTETIRVFLLDDHDVVREGLRFLLERTDDIEVVGDSGLGRRGDRPHPRPQAARGRARRPAAGRLRDRGLPRDPRRRPEHPGPDPDVVRRRRGAVRGDHGGGVGLRAQGDPAAATSSTRSARSRPATR